MPHIARQPVGGRGGNLVADLRRSRCDDDELTTCTDKSPRFIASARGDETWRGVGGRIVSDARFVVPMLVFVALAVTVASGASLPGDAAAHRLAQRRAGTPVVGSVTDFLAGTAIEIFSPASLRHLLSSSPRAGACG